MLKKKLVAIVLTGAVALGNFSGVSTPIKGGDSATQATIFEGIRNDLPNHSLIWSDEFEGTSLDPSKWSWEGATGSGGYGNQELQDYEPEYSKVEKGNLVIKPQFQWNKGTDSYVKGSAYSTKLWTKDLAHFKNGRIEVRAKLPKGKGTCASFWMLGENGNWPARGEIDIFGTTSQLEKTMIPQFVYCEKFCGMASSSGPKHFDSTVETATSEFHTYGIEWTEKQVIFYIDGNRTGIYDPNRYDANNQGTSRNDIWPFKQPFFFVLTCSVGGSLGGDVTTQYWSKIAEENNIETYQDYMYIDYVRVYSLNTAEVTTRNEETTGNTNPTTVNEPSSSEITTGKNDVITTKKQEAKVSVGNAVIKAASKKKSAKKANIVLNKVNKATGYEVQIAGTKSFKKILVSKKGKKVSFNISSKKIRTAKKLFARARAYVTRSGKDYYGGWSEAKKIKIKK